MSWTPSTGDCRGGAGGAHSFPRPVGMSLLVEAWLTLRIRICEIPASELFSEFRTYSSPNLEKDLTHTPVPHPVPAQRLGQLLTENRCTGPGFIVESRGLPWG